MKTYSKVHNYSENMKATVAIFSFKGRADICWEELRNVKDIRENELSWRIFERYSGRSTYLKGTVTKILRNLMSPN